MTSPNTRDAEMCERAIFPENLKCAVPKKQTHAHARFVQTRHGSVTYVCQKKPSMDAKSTLQHNVIYSVTLASIDADGECNKPADTRAHTDVKSFRASCLGL